MWLTSRSPRLARRDCRSLVRQRPLRRPDRHLGCPSSNWVPERLIGVGRVTPGEPSNRQGRRVLHGQGDRGDSHQGSEARPTNRMQAASRPRRPLPQPLGSRHDSRKPRTAQRGPESGPAGCRYCARLGLRRLRRYRRGLRRITGGAAWAPAGSPAVPGGLRGLRGLRWLRRGHRWCLRGFGGVTSRCLGGLRPGCHHGRAATGVLRLTPRPRLNAGPGMSVGRGSFLGRAAATLLRRCVLPALYRGDRVMQREPRRPVRGIAAGAEREPGQRLRGITGPGAGERPQSGGQPANCDRRDPRDPHGHKAGQRDFRPVLHDDLGVVAMTSVWSRYRILGAGDCCPGGADGYPSRAVGAVTPHSRNAPRPELEGFGPSVSPPKLP